MSVLERLEFYLPRIPVKIDEEIDNEGGWEADYEDALKLNVQRIRMTSAAWERLVSQCA